MLYKIILLFNQVVERQNNRVDERQINRVVERPNNQVVERQNDVVQNPVVHIIYTPKYPIAVHYHGTRRSAPAVIKELPHLVKTKKIQFKAEVEKEKSVKDGIAEIVMSETDTLVFYVKKSRKYRKVKQIDQELQKMVRKKGCPGAELFAIVVKGPIQNRPEDVDPNQNGPEDVDPNQNRPEDVDPNKMGPRDVVNVELDNRREGRISDEEDVSDNRQSL